MKLATTTALLALTPYTPTFAWSIGRFPSHGVVLRPFVVSQTARSLCDQQNALVNRVFRQTSPQYEVIDDDEKFQVAVDVPGVKPEDINVSIDEAANILSIQGRRQSLNDAYKFTSKFSQSFSLDSAVDIGRFTANIKNGVLVVTAPKDFKRVEQFARSIPITTSDDEVVSRDQSDSLSEQETKDISVASKDVNDTPANMNKRDSDDSKDDHLKDAEHEKM